MRALTWHGKHDVRVDTVPDPQIVNPRDAIIEVTATAICAVMGTAAQAENIGVSMALFDDNFLTVLRNGRNVGGGPVAGVDRLALVNMMLGHDLAHASRGRALPAVLLLAAVPVVATVML